MSCRPTLAWLLIFGVALRVDLARADPSPAEISSARRAFEAAVRLENEQRWAEAERNLREALVVKDTPGLRFHLGRCSAEQGHLLDAAHEYEQARQLLLHGAKAPDVQKLLGPASVAVNLRIPRLSLDIPPDLKNPSVWLDGKAYPPSELALGVALDPGAHQLRVSAPARREFERAIALKDGERAEIRLDLPIAAPPLSAPVAKGRAALLPSPLPIEVDTNSVPANPPRTKTYLLVGESVVMLAGLAVAIGYRVAASKANGRVELSQGRIDGAAPESAANACAQAEHSDLSGACSDLKSALDDHARAILLSDVGFVTAGVGAAALLTTWLAYPNPKTATSRLDLQLSAGLGRLKLSGRF